MANFSISYLYQIVDRMSPTLRKINNKINQHNKELKENKLSWEKLTKSVKRYTSSMMSAGRRLDAFNQKLLDSTGSFVALGAGITTLAFPIKKAIDFEDALTGIAKAADLEKGSAQFAEMKQSIIDMSYEIPIATNELAEMAAAGARLGIPAEKLKGFVELTAQTAVAFDMTGEVAGEALADISAKMNIPITKMKDMTASINAVENNFSVRGKQIIDVVGRISGEAKALGFTPEQTAGIAGFARIVESSTELAGSGVKQLIAKMRDIPSLNDQLLKDPEKAIKDLVNKFAKMPKELRDAKIDEDFGAGAGGFLRKAAGSAELYAKVMGTVGNTQKNVNTFNKEYIAQLGTTKARAMIAGNALTNISTAIGDALLPATYDSLMAFANFGKTIQEFITKNHWLVQIIAVVIGSFVSLIAIVKVAQLGAVAYQGALLAVAAVQKLTAVRTLAMNAAMLTWNATTKAITATMAVLRAGLLAINIVMFANPIGILVAGVGAFAAALAGIIIYWDDIKAGIDSAIESATEFVRSLFCGDEEQPNVNPKMSGADASGSNSGPKGSIDINVTGTNAQVTGTSVAGKGLRDTGMIKFSSLMNK